LRLQAPHLISERIRVDAQGDGLTADNGHRLTRIAEELAVCAEPHDGDDDGKDPGRRGQQSATLKALAIAARQLAS
jgi:hypothetical protein